ncbi:hypothetical protein TBR22_A33860 [Luteitalea sp. TBR-22]|uniref:hypothetical protein n=1 Tax=Luteitalea sp. TBR-22 TaxID=2802971 RepID=UPI001AF47ED5|nr:hypothetical protein [Luteitalea sp. TBR-22]BCS34157.1 hypothetical protein TBR22_A33860 [Luteitalea sp. TBR-22]
MTYAASLLVAALATAPLAQPVPQVAAPAMTPGAPQAGPGDLWLVIYSVMPDKAPQFEALARQVREALARSPQEVRQAQARELRIHRSSLPAQDGKLMYFLQISALTGDQDRSGFDALIEAVLPEQATALKKQLAATLDPANPSGNTYLINVR